MPIFLFFLFCFSRNDRFPAATSCRISFTERFPCWTCIPSFSLHAVHSSLLRSFLHAGTVRNNKKRREFYWLEINWTISIVCLFVFWFFSDCCHELLGHMPLLANPSFAQFSQELGLASLGASDDDIHKLATVRFERLKQFIKKKELDWSEKSLQLYFFTVEFGLCKQDGTLRVYGAGLLSSVAELRHAMTDSAKTLRFEPEITCKQECIITAFQTAYYYTDSIEEAKEKMR